MNRRRKEGRKKGKKEGQNKIKKRGESEGGRKGKGSTNEHIIGSGIAYSSLCWAYFSTTHQSRSATWSSTV